MASRSPSEWGTSWPGGYLCLSRDWRVTLGPSAKGGPAERFLNSGYCLVTGEHISYYQYSILYLILRLVIPTLQLPNQVLPAISVELDWGCRRPPADRPFICPGKPWTTEIPHCSCNDFMNICLFLFTSVWFVCVFLGFSKNYKESVCFSQYLLGLIHLFIKTNLAKMLAAQHHWLNLFTQVPYILDTSSR